MQTNLGGDRLGSGNKLKVEMHNYSRSTHDMSYILRTTMAAGTLVPFMKELALPGDTYDINLGCDVKTHPTIGPLFGSYKIQLDVFQCPIRLYQGQLHNNKLGVGLNMASVKLPTISLPAVEIATTDVGTINMNTAQVNPSSIINYLGIVGIGYNENEADLTREFNAIPLLAYWDIYKNYYANKQEEIGAVIHTPLVGSTQFITGITVGGAALTQTTGGTPRTLENGTQIVVTATAAQDLNQILFLINGGPSPRGLLEIATLLSTAGFVYTLIYNFPQEGIKIARNWDYTTGTEATTLPIQIDTFPLENIDTMRERILAHAVNSTAFNLNTQNLEPYSHLIGREDDQTAIMQTQEGLGLKTYQSDLFNNWIQTEWIDGTNGISEVTAIDTSAGNFTIDTLNLSKKVYDMLNRIAISGGSYNDWLSAVYKETGLGKCESPMYMGGLIKELVFQEIVSQSETPSGEAGGTQPLGTLAGKGIMAKKHKGGKITIKVDEPSYIIGIISLTPRLDYSQGNDWDVHLRTMDDLHKPALDEIGFQELITEQMAYWSTNWNGTEWVTKSAGKQPAWINYMTNVNKVKGNFAIEDNEGFMILNRGYTPVVDTGEVIIEDLTTYIDPSKFNNIFAQTSLDSQNFWTQIGIDMTVRRLISAKLIPNL